MLYICCPQTGKDTPTGMDAPKGADLSAIHDNYVSCPHCWQTHRWDGTDAYQKAAVTRPPAPGTPTGGARGARR
jgi:hypothetical protein